MGVDVELKVQNLTLLYWKSYFDKITLGMFFTDSDLQVIENIKYDEENVEEEPHTEYIYSTSVQKAIDRLDSAGYTLNSIEAKFNERKYRCLDYFSLLYPHYSDDEFDEAQEMRINKYVTFKKWYNSVWKYAKYGLVNDLYSFYWNDNEDPSILPKTECDKIVYNSLKDGERSYFGCLYEEFDHINTIRLILEKCPRDETLFVNITEMVGWTYSSIDEMRLGEPNEKTIVLVEGTNDKEILEFALKNIYPHLYNLYYFMDFEFGNVKKRRGGVDTISNNLKAFVYSKLRARFIAIFDNDTVGTQAMKRLVYEIGDLPENFRVINYPDITRAKKYPTIGTNGKMILDNINGRACSIELYLPEFILKKNTIYPPIEWESRIKAKIGTQELQEYQGAVSSKAEIEETFKKYKKAVEKGEKEFNVSDWEYIKKLLDVIVNAFH